MVGNRVFFLWKGESLAKTALSLSLILARSGILFGVSVFDVFWFFLVFLVCRVFEEVDWWV